MDKANNAAPRPGIDKKKVAGVILAAAAIVGLSATPALARLAANHNETVLRLN